MKKMTLAQLMGESYKNRIVFGCTYKQMNAFMHSTIHYHIIVTD